VLYGEESSDGYEDFKEHLILKFWGGEHISSDVCIFIIFING
jgi:hypothetical protein